MKNNVCRILIFVILFLLFQAGCVNADIGKESSQASLMTDEYKNNITKENKELTSNLPYANESQIHTDSAILYTNNNSNKKNITVCVNAGHGTSGGESVKTYCHPNHTAKVTGGTTGEGSIQAIAVSSGMDFADGTPERSATLREALIFKDVLLSNGYNVLMIREGDDIQLDNVARTVLANSYANCHIAIHWDSTDWDKGAFYMAVPKHDSAYLAMEPVASTYQKSDTLGESLIDGLRSQGVKIFENGSMQQDLTQTSYSSVPSIDIELGDKTSDISEENLVKLAGGLLLGVSKYYNENDITLPSGGGSSSGSSTQAKDKDSLIEKGINGIKQEILESVDFILGCIDVLQNIIDRLVTSDLGTTKDATILYLSGDIKSNQKINNYVDFKSETIEKPDFTIDGTDEGYTSSTPIPFIPVDVYSVASNSVSNLDINFLTGRNNTKEHPADSIWSNITKLINSVIHIVIYLSAAFLFVSLIWHGINVVINAIAPERKAKHMGGLIDFVKAMLMFVGCIIIMALCIFLSDQLISIIGLKKVPKLPYTVSVETAKCSFNTNLTGYVRYLSQVTNFEKLGIKILYTFEYLGLVIANTAVVITMVLRIIWIIFLSIIGPIIAAAYGLQFKKVMGLNYKDWIIKYLKWSTIPVIIALGYSIITRVL